MAALAAGVLALLAALRFGGGIVETQIPGLPSAGPLTDWGLPLSRFCLDVCGVACVGTLLAALLAPAASPESAACTRAAGWWALGLAACAAMSYLLTVSSMIPMPLTHLLAVPDLVGFGTSVPQTQALLAVLIIATALVPLTLLPRVPGWIRLALAAFALLPPAYVGHAASAGEHDVAISALMSHLLAVSVWVGGLAAVLVHFRRSQHLAVVLPRFSAVALWCFAAVTLSGVVGAWVRLNTPADLWETSYGLLLVAKTVALAVLAWCGWNHRRRTVQGVARRSVRHTFVRLAAGEVIVMAVAMGLAVGLSRTPPPGGHGGSPPAPFSLGGLITEVRLDTTILLLLAPPAIGYLLWARRRPSWPAARTIAWYAGLALAALVLLGGVASYARAMPSVHALQHVVLSVIVPVLLCLGAPATLAARRPGAATRSGSVVTHPAFLLAVSTLPGLLLYGTDWLAWSLSGWAPHLLTALLFLGAGLLVFWVVTGVDPLPRPLPAPARAWLLAAVTVVQLGVGAALLFGPQVAADWYATAVPATDVLADQRLAGAIHLILPLPPLAVLAIRLTAPSRRTPAMLRTGRAAQTTIPQRVVRPGS
ncbi:cytochrome c oxidase assembly protein [Nonomuraea sp. NPDC002799]